MLNVMKCEFNYMHILQLQSFPPPPPLSVSAGCHGIQPLFLSHSLCFNERNNMRYLFINVRSGPILSHCHCHSPSLSPSPRLSRLQLENFICKCTQRELQSWRGREVVHMACGWEEAINHIHRLPVRASERAFNLHMAGAYRETRVGDGGSYKWNNERNEDNKQSWDIIQILFNFNI